MQFVHLNFGEEYKYLCNNVLIIDTILQGRIQWKPMYIFDAMYFNLFMIDYLFLLCWIKACVTNRAVRRESLWRVRFLGRRVRDSCRKNVKNEVRPLEEKREVVSSLQQV